MALAGVKVLRTAVWAEAFVTQVDAVVIFLEEGYGKLWSVNDKP